MRRSTWVWLLVLLAVCFLLLVAWQVTVMSLPNRDDAAVEKLAKWDAGVLRSGRLTPLHFISGGYGDDQGEVEAVSLSGKITEEHVAVLLSLRSCGRLCLTRCTFSDPGLLARLSEMPSLEGLQLIHHTVTDQDLINALPHFQKLQYLYLQDNDITDAVVDTIAGLPNLRAVSTAGTKITPAGVARLQQLRPGLKVNTTLQPPF